MKILAFTDIHTDEQALTEIEAKLKSADLIINTGDFSWLGQGTTEMIHRFNSWKKPMLLIHGNHEWIEEVYALTKDCKHITLMHNQIKMIDEIMFIGHGGEWYHQNTPEFEGLIPAIKQAIKEHKPKKIVLLVHMPVYNTKQDLIYGAHRGNLSYRNFVDKYQPDLVLFGHFHESFHIKDKIGKTILINPGPDGELINL